MLCFQLLCNLFSETMRIQLLHVIFFFIGEGQDFVVGIHNCKLIWYNYLSPCVVCSHLGALGLSYFVCNVYLFLCTCDLLIYKIVKNNVIYTSSMTLST